MKIGCIYVAHNTEDLVPASLRPWITARKERLVGCEFVICAVSMPFAGFQSEPDDTTKTMLEASQFCGEIDHVILGSEPVKETEARGFALKWLRDQGCEISVMVDSDEVWTTEQIAATLSFVETHPFLSWFRVCYRNYVFDKNTYLVEPFTPPRIHRLHPLGYTAHGFYDDNNVLYSGGITRDLKRDTILAHGTIPKSLVWVRHLSWLSNDRSRRKIQYQLEGRKWPSCSFAWDDSKGGLIFNPAMPAPEIARDGEI